MLALTPLQLQTLEFMPRGGARGQNLGHLRIFAFFFFFFYAPNFEKVGDILVSACPYVYMCVCMYSFSRYRLETSWIPHGKIADTYFWFSLNYLPLLNYGPLTDKGMKFCKCSISKSIIARNLKLVMLIGDDD